MIFIFSESGGNFGSKCVFCVILPNFWKFFFWSFEKKNNFQDLSPKVTWNSRLGVFLVSIISILSVLIYILFSILIVSKLRSTDLALSQKTKRLQKQLAKSLAVQATIPLIVDLFPCFFVWYMPIFKVNIGYWTYWFASIFISFFPVFDPLAMFYFLPVFRVRLRQILRMKERPARVSAMTHTDISRFF